MAKGFEINKRAIRKMTQDIEREFAKNPVKIPLEADTSGVHLPAAATVNNYHGPVVTVTGDNAQIAWENDNVSQTQNRVEQIAPGYEDLARLVTDLLANLDTLALEGTDAEDVRANADAVLGEVVKEKPDQSAIKRGVTMLKGLLAPVATGIGAAVTAESAETARQVIEGLANSVPF